jgi:hypothetical protein
MLECYVYTTNLIIEAPPPKGTRLQDVAHAPKHDVSIEIYLAPNPDKSVALVNDDSIAIEKLAVGVRGEVVSDLG